MEPRPGTNLHRRSGRRGSESELDLKRKDIQRTLCDLCGLLLKLFPRVRPGGAKSNSPIPNRGRRTTTRTRTIEKEEKTLNTYEVWAMPLDPSGRKQSLRFSPALIIMNLTHTSNSMGVCVTRSDLSSFQGGSRRGRVPRVKPTASICYRSGVFKANRRFAVLSRRSRMRLHTQL